MTGARLVVRGDALVEAVLGACCAVLATVAPRQGAWRLPRDAPAAVVAVIAAALLVLAAWLWWRSRRPDRSLLVLLGAGNGTTAALLFWYAAIVPAGSAIVALLSAAGVALLVLATVQLTLARRAAAQTGADAAGTSVAAVRTRTGGDPTR